MSEGEGAVASDDKVRAWDLPTRVFHWLLVLLILLSWASWRYSEALGDPALKLHRWNGHAILTLVVWRVLWGLVGSSTSRFSAWLWWPWTAAIYGIRLLRGQTPLYLSHNPLGAYMILLLLAAVTAQAVSGLFAVEHNDLTGGPLYRLLSEEGQKRITEWHTSFFYWWALGAGADPHPRQLLVRPGQEGAPHHRHGHRPQARRRLPRRAGGRHSWAGRCCARWCASWWPRDWYSARSTARWGARYFDRRHRMRREGRCHSSCKA